MRCYDASQVPDDMSRAATICPASTCHIKISVVTETNQSLWDTCDAVCCQVMCVRNASLRCELAFEIDAHHVLRCLACRFHE